jgi:hypothetical protein
VILRTLVLVYFITQLMSSGAFSCGCISFGGCPGLGNEKDPVFTGTVLEITDLTPTTDEAFLSSRKARIHVNESFGGLASDIDEVDVLTGVGGGDCGIPFKPGEVYLIAASRGNDGFLHTGACSYTQKIEFAGAALRVLRKRRDGYKVPALTGRIAQHDRNFQGNLGGLEPKHLANTRIRIKGGNGVYETWSDAEGLYEIYNVPPGKYEFDPELPFGTTLSWFIESDKPLAPFYLERSCEDRDIEVFAGGSIQGRVLDSFNNALPHALVYIVPVDTKVLPKARQGYWVGQYEEGSFKFVHIPPGNYIILVNPDDSRDPDFPYGRTFYPGAHDRTSARVISVSAGEQIKDADIHVQEQFAARRLTVSVVWENGQLIRDYVSVEAKGTVNTMAETDRSTVHLNLLPNEDYEVEARLFCQYLDDQSVGPGATLHSNKARLKARDGQFELLLTIPSTSCPELPGKKSLTGDN